MKNNDKLVQFVSSKQFYEKCLKVDRKTLKRWLDKREMLLDQGKVDEADLTSPPPKILPGRVQRGFLLDDILKFIDKNSRS